jgi:DNA-binding NarL/FixJ family response regulator
VNSTPVHLKNAELPGIIRAGQYDLEVAVHHADANDSPLANTDVQQLCVVIVDDHALLRKGTRQILSEAIGIAVVAEAANGADALAAVASTRPDVVLVDIRLPDQNGIELARNIVEHYPDSKVVILSAYDDEDYVRAAMDVGVVGYLLKTMPGDDLVRAVRAAAGGMTVLDPAVRDSLANPRSRPAREEAFAALTWREKQVVQLVAEGLANKNIAIQLGISARTVEGHLNHVFVKLGVSSRTELVRLALSASEQKHQEPRG